MAEPPDSEIYSWVRFSKEGFHFLRSSVQYYLRLLESDLKGIKADPELAALFPDGKIHSYPLNEEIDRAKNVLEFLDHTIEKADTNAWHYRATVSHGLVRFLKSCRILYVAYLRLKRDEFNSQHGVSKQGVDAIDRRLSELEEATGTGIFADAIPYPLSAPTVESLKQRMSGTQSKLEPNATRPVVIDTIEIRDPALRARCLDLFKLFQDDNQTERLDTVVTEATRILEDRLRGLSNAPAACTGVDLAKHAFNPEKPVLRLSEISAEQDAAHLLFRGVFG